MLVHATLIVLLVLLPRLTRGPQIPENALFVELAPAFPSRAAAEAPSVEAPAPPPVAEPDEGVRMETSAPPKKLEPLEEVKPVEKPPEPKPEPASPAPDPGEAGEGPGAEVLGGPDAGHSISPLAGGEVEFAWYRASVTAALYSNWQRPILTGLREPIEVGVSFEIARDGRVVNLQVEAPSGVPSLDRSALRAVSDASPLPPLPSNWRQPRLEAVFVFRLYPEGV
jgi:TonB family protein